MANSNSNIPVRISSPGSHAVLKHSIAIHVLPPSLLGLAKCGRDRPGSLLGGIADGTEEQLAKRLPLLKGEHRHGGFPQAVTEKMSHRVRPQGIVMILDAVSLPARAEGPIQVRRRPKFIRHQTPVFL